MSLPSPRYRFATEAQWRLCLTAALGETMILDPAKGKLVAERPPGDVLAFAVAPGGDSFWIDARGRLAADACIGPALGAIRRLLIGRNRLWAGTAHAATEIDRRSLQPLLTISLPGLCDIAPAASDGLWLLRKQRVWQIDSAGRSKGRGFLLAERAISLAAVGGKLAALSPNGRRVELIATAGGRRVAVDLDSLPGRGAGPAAGGAAAGFTGKRIFGGSGRFLVMGEWDDGEAGYLLLDPNGAVAVRARWTGGSAPLDLVLSGADLFAAFGSENAVELRRFAAMARAGGEARLTPALDTETLSGGWQRAEIEARLPESATLSIRWAATSDENLRARVERAAEDPDRPDDSRLERVGRLLDGCWSGWVTYVGEPGGGDAPERFTVPIDAPGQPIAWVELRLMRNGASMSPRVEALAILHDGPSLIEHLPAIYRGSGDGDGTMRRLVGVIEATTQEIDARIAGMAERLDPDRTDAAWLPALAAMLGLPFDESLDVAMQRRLLGAAPVILARRGARRGLLAMVGALFPDRPIEIVDRTGQLAAIALGGPGFAGSSLPALLAGPSKRVPRLGARLVLGRTALCPADPCDRGSIAPTPEVSVSIAASGGERRLYDSAVRQMLDAMIPAGIRLRLRWTERGATPAGTSRLPTSIGSPRPLRIGDGGRLGASFIGGRADPRLDREGTTPVRHRLL
ncbi:MAG TPA: phage tail protein [Allosphingosinicella sp.]|nr:phage tail protein [Allosphingosinicella sp.]